MAQPTFVPHLRNADRESIIAALALWGWEPETTGGGCSALTRYHEDGSYQMLTQPEGGEMPESWEEQAWLGTYDAGDGGEAKALVEGTLRALYRMGLLAPLPNWTFDGEPVTATAESIIDDNRRCETPLTDDEERFLLRARVGDSAYLGACVEVVRCP